LPGCKRLFLLSPRTLSAFARLGRKRNTGVMVEGRKSIAEEKPKSVELARSLQRHAHASSAFGTPSAVERTVEWIAWHGATMRLSKVAALALIVGGTGSMSVSPALAASDCPKLAELADWGQNSTADINVASGASCLFPITMRGTASSSDILQKPTHGKLTKLNLTTYEYKAKARYKGSDTFAIKATGQGRRLLARP